MNPITTSQMIVDWTRTFYGFGLELECDVAGKCDVARIRGDHPLQHCGMEHAVRTWGNCEPERVTLLKGTTFVVFGRPRKLPTYKIMDQVSCRLNERLACQRDECANKATVFMDFYCFNREFSLSG